MKLSIKMKLSNDTTVSTNIAGIVHLSNYLILYDVYYIPTFHVNLIYASKLIDSSTCTLKFTNNDCFILQKKSSRMIGLAERYGDLYVLQAQAALNPSFSLLSSNLVSNSTSFLWHRRLGHRSPFVHKLLATQYSDIVYSFNKDSPCYFFHLSKQKHLPYTDNTSYSSGSFDILHAYI